MGDYFICPECDEEFQEGEAQVSVKKVQFTETDDAIQATSMVYCPCCTNVVVAIFDSMECFNSN